MRNNVFASPSQSESVPEHSSLSLFLSSTSVFQLCVGGLPHKVEQTATVLKGVLHDLHCFSFGEHEIIYFFEQVLCRIKYAVSFAQAVTNHHYTNLVIYYDFYFMIC